ATFSGLGIHNTGVYKLLFTATSLPVRTATDSTIVATLMADSVPVPNLNGSVNSAQSLVFRVLPGDTILTVTLSGPTTGNGDADLLVRFGAAPDIENGIFDCFPNLAGNNEVCAFHSPAPGLWYASIFAFFSYSNVTITATASGH
ncbi:MAG TPA: PPC domain-containing protein, partial [Gemmatimonadales bacterium]